jgi:hypothetical protein
MIGLQQCICCTTTTVAAYAMRHKISARAVIPERAQRLSIATIIDTLILTKQGDNMIALRYPEMAPQARYRRAPMLHTLRSIDPSYLGS